MKGRRNIRDSYEANLAHGDLGWQLKLWRGDFWVTVAVVVLGKMNASVSTHVMGLHNFQNVILVFPLRVSVAPLQLLLSGLKQRAMASSASSSAGALGSLSGDVLDAPTGSFALCGDVACARADSELCGFASPSRAGAG